MKTNSLLGRRTYCCNGKTLPAAFFFCQCIIALIYRKKFGKHGLCRYMLTKHASKWRLDRKASKIVISNLRTHGTIIENFQTFTISGDSIISFL